MTEGAARGSQSITATRARLAAIRQGKKGSPTPQLSPNLKLVLFVAVGALGVAAALGLWSPFRAAAVAAVLGDGQACLPVCFAFCKIVLSSA